MKNERRNSYNKKVGSPRVELCSVSLVCLFVMLGNISFAAKAVPIQISNWYLEPTVDVTFGRSEAEFFAGNETTDDFYVGVNPKVVLSNKTQNREIFFSYELDAVRFDENSEGDFESSFFEGEYRQSVSNHSVVSIRGDYRESSQTNGVRSELQAINPISENQRIDIEAKELVLKYEFYGKKRQKTGHLFEVSIAAGETDFIAIGDDVPSLAAVEDRDFDFLRFDVKWRYRWSTGSSVFVNFNTIDHDFREDNITFNSQLDNLQTEFVVGAELQFRRNFSGEIGIGIVNKSFDDLDLDIDTPSFYGELEYTPTALDTFQLEAQRRPLNQAGSGLFQDYREIELSWLRRFSRRWSFETFVSAAAVDYEQSVREDDIFRYGVSLEYRVSRISDLVFGYRFIDDDSNQDEFDYNAENFFITISTGL